MDLAQVEKDLRHRLEDYDWPGVEEICDRLVELILAAGAEFPIARSRSILHQLRRKRRFGAMLRVAEALLLYSDSHPLIRRQYAQALIDTGRFAAAQAVLEDLEELGDVPKAEVSEVRGLTGRLFKQKFVKTPTSSSANREELLRRSITEYLQGFEANRRNYWHGINVVALVARANREKIDTSQFPEVSETATELLSTLDEIESESVEPPTAWEHATRMEAHIALGQYEEALRSATEYCTSEAADSFEISGTLRQLVEIWQLSDSEAPGDELLPVLRSSLLENEGGSVKMRPESVSNQGVKLEGIFSENVPRTIKWYREGLERSASIARVELPDGRGIGTGGVVSARDFFPDRDGLLLLTNSHVVSINPSDSGLPPGEVQVNLQGHELICELGDIVWSSPQTELDASFVEIKGLTDAEPLPLSKSPVSMTRPAPRVYVIGHPNGRDLEISLNDNKLVAANERVVHYRAPTEPGSSGSPVFDQNAWRVIALHHGGGDRLPRIDDVPGTYEANEGISIHAIKAAIIQDYPVEKKDDKASHAL